MPPSRTVPLLPGGLADPARPCLVRAQDVLRFQGQGGRQDEVGVARGVGEERVVDDREEVLPREAAAHGAGVRTGHRGVVGRDEERADRPKSSLRADSTPLPTPYAEEAWQTTRCWAVRLTVIRDMV